MRKLNIIYIVLIISSLLPQRMFAFTYLGSVEGLGDPVISADARVLGMGNTSVAASYNVNALFYNPANILKTVRPALTLGAGIFPVKETIETDSAPTMFSSAAHLKYMSIAGIYPLKAGYGFGVGYRPVMDMNYEHSRDIYYSGVLKQTKEYDSNGGIGSTSLAYALNISYALRIGFSYDMIRGKKDAETIHVTTGSRKVIEESENSYRGARYTAGLDWGSSSDKFNAGLKWVSSSNLKNSWKIKRSTFNWASSAWPVSPDSESNSEGTLEYTFPAELGFGLNYRFLERGVSVLSVDIVKTYWGDLRYKETKNTVASNYNIKQDPHYRNTIRVSLGVEHGIAEKTMLRYGFTHIPHYSRTSCDTTMFTAGLGFSLGKDLGIDIAGAYGRRNFYGQNVFFDDDEMVDERIVSLLCSTVWMFR